MVFDPICQRSALNAEMYSVSWPIFILFSSTICETTCSHESAEKGAVSAIYATMGGRNHMEDYWIRIENQRGTGIYAVFDGHDGNYSSHYTKDKLTEKFENAIDCKHFAYTGEPNGKTNFKRMLINFIAEVEAHLEKTTFERVHRSGTTCLIVIAEKNLLTVANVGDSRAVMCDFFGVAIDLSVDHKPWENKVERQRILEARGLIYHSGVWRVHGLAMSRSLGDTRRKKSNVIIATPELYTFDLNKYRPKFIILASDGVWDVLKSEIAVAFIRDHHLNDEDFGAKALADEAIAAGSTDNITVLIVVFKNGHYEVGAN